jgi:mitochondrial fission protein ELM1
MKKTKSSILILTDGKAGHENQSRAFASQLGAEYAVVKVAYKSKFTKLLSYVFDFFGICSSKLFYLEGDFPSAGEFDVVLGTGSGTFYPVKTISRMIGAKCAVVLTPRGYKMSGFDCILAPIFDNPPPADNVIVVPANIVRNDAMFYSASVKDFRAKVPATGNKIVAVIIGGPCKKATMDAAWMKSMLKRIEDDVARDFPSEKVELYVTTSRRTPKDVEKVVDDFNWDYKLIYSRDTYNPVPAFVALAERLYVSADSTGMLTEACTCGNGDVFVLDDLLPGNHKYRRFVESLTAGGFLGGRKKICINEAFAKAKKLLGV